MGDKNLASIDLSGLGSDILDQLNKATQRIAGGGTKNRRISLRGSKFRLLVNGEQISVSKDDSLNMIIVSAGSISRTYYEGVYDANVAVRPSCWSTDTASNKPASDVPKDSVQAKSCLDCPNNIKGSGQGNSRACRYDQRLAVLLENDADNIYQLKLPATSIFGDASGSDMPLMAYTRFLQAQNIPIMAVLTKVSFDEDSDVPKLLFHPERGLTPAEINNVVTKMDSPEAEKAISMTVALAEGSIKKLEAPEDEDEDEDEEVVEVVKPTKKKKTKKKAKVVVEEEEEDEDEEVEEPSKFKGKGSPSDDEDDEDDDLDALASKFLG
tara:strand:- start:588 stop:1562 length:975 start_codon:yes stop_codon:yes gene_type:complete